MRLVVDEHADDVVLGALRLYAKTRLRAFDFGGELSSGRDRSQVQDRIRDAGSGTTEIAVDAFVTAGLNLRREGT